MKIPNLIIRLFAAGALFVCSVVSMRAQTTFSRPSTTTTYVTETTETPGPYPGAPSTITTTQKAVTVPSIERWSFRGNSDGTWTVTNPQASTTTVSPEEAGIYFRQNIKNASPNNPYTNDQTGQKVTPTNNGGTSGAGGGGGANGLPCPWDDDQPNEDWTDISVG